MSEGKKRRELVAEAMDREPWLKHVRTHGQRPASARHVARPTAVAAAARPASARPASACRPARQAAGRGRVRTHRWAQDHTQTRSQTQPAPPKTKKITTRQTDRTAMYTARDVGRMTYSVREKRLLCGVVAARQPFTPRSAPQRPASGRVARPPPPAHSEAKEAADNVRQEHKLVDSVKNDAHRGPAAASRKQSDVQYLSAMLGVPDGTWAFAPSENAAYSGSAALCASGQRRLLMPTWARLAHRVELMQQQNREVSDLLSGLASTTAVPVNQQVGPTTEDSAVLPAWPQDGPLGSINPQKIATGWRGLPQSRRTCAFGNAATDQSSYGDSRESAVCARQLQQKVKIGLEPGRDWSELMW